MTLIKNGRGWITVKMSFPDGLIQFANVEKQAGIWFISETEITPKAMEWLVASNKAFLTPSEVRKLRKNGNIVASANPEYLEPWWKEFIRAKKEEYQRLYTPEFSDI